MWIWYVAEYRCPPSIVWCSEVLEYEGSVEPTSYILLGRSPACFPSPFNALAGVANGHDGNYQMTASLISVSRICSATPIAVTLSRWCQVFVGEKFCVDVQITAQPATASLLLSHSSLHSKGAWDIAGQFLRDWAWFRQIVSLELQITPILISTTGRCS